MITQKCIHSGLGSSVEEPLVWVMSYRLESILGWKECGRVEVAAWWRPEALHTLGGVTTPELMWDVEHLSVNC